ncbi:ribosomal protein [Hirsutella rhossiliensis]|uniref:Ribosomal protein l34 domain-containing protein n=1 Tax=Hirsutella rhossiliensis TaxID=111463 RepID=A0A9P8N5C3_9HYPO|nr:ribosomal protein l34 domain-containing protein [Hirsutella rhossiliensis]KAH0967918.1 ribosomal protein l34 domain-containing protein [Hirsutella rhossiliensis]
MQLLTTRLARPLLSKPLSSPSRTFSTLSPLRPALSPFRQRAGTSPFVLANTGFAPTPAAAAAAPSDIVPSSAVSSHPALSGLQLRFGPRNTMNGHTRLIQKRRHGFLHRMRSKTGRRILLRRKLKGRRQLGW